MPVSKQGSEAGQGGGSVFENGSYGPWARLLTSEDIDAIQLFIKSHTKAAGLDMVIINSELDKISKKDISLLGQSNLTLRLRKTKGGDKQC